MSSAARIPDSFGRWQLWAPFPPPLIMALGLRDSTLPAGHCKGHADLFRTDGGWRQKLHPGLGRPGLQRCVCDLGCAVRSFQASRGILTCARGGGTPPSRGSEDWLVSTRYAKHLEDYPTGGKNCNFSGSYHDQVDPFSEAHHLCTFLTSSEMRLCLSAGGTWQLDWQGFFFAAHERVACSPVGCCFRLDGMDGKWQQPTLPWLRLGYVPRDRVYSLMKPFSKVSGI